MEENEVINQKDLIIGTEINAKIKIADIALTCFDIYNSSENCSKTM